MDRKVLLAMVLIMAVLFLDQAIQAQAGPVAAGKRIAAGRVARWVPGCRPDRGTRWNGPGESRRGHGRAGHARG